MAMQSGFIKRIRDIMRMDAGINGDAQRIEQMVWMLFLKVYDAKEDDWEINEDDYVSIIPEECRWRNWAQADDNGHAMTGDKLLNFVNNTLFPTLKELPVTPDTPVKKAIVKSTFEDANNYMKDGVYLRQVIDVIDEIEFDDVKESHAFGFVYEEILKDLQAAGSSGEFYTPRAVTDFMALMIKPQLGEHMADFACGTGGFITSWLGQLSKQVTDTEDQKKLDDSIYGIEKKPFPYLLCVTNMLLHDIEVPNIYHMNSLKHNLLDYTDSDKFDVILMNPPYGGHEDKSIQGFFPDDLASSETADLFMSVIMYRLKKNGRAAVVVPDGFLFGLDNAKVAIKKKLITEFNLHTIVRLPGSVFSPYTSISTNLLFFDNTKPTEDTWFYRVDIPSDRKHFSKTKPMELKHFDDCIAWWNDRKEIMLGDEPKAQRFTADYLLNDQGCNIDLCGYPHEEEDVLTPLDTIRNYQEIRATLNAEIDHALSALESSLNGDTTKVTGFNAQNKGCAILWQKLEEINAKFPEEMKKSILQYAIQGKLAEQRTEEGTGEILYQQIQKKKASLIKAGKIKNEKPLPKITEDEIPFEIPETWKWCYIGDLFLHNTGKAQNSSGSSTGTIRKFITTSNLYWNQFDFSKVKEMPFTDKELERCTVQKGDLLVCEGGDCGRSAVWNYDEEVCIQNHVHRLRPYVEIDIYYFYYIFYLYKNTGRLRGRGVAIQGLSNEAIHKVMVPLPPVGEQHRIVAKIEELFPYCDQPTK